MRTGFIVHLVVDKNVCYRFTSPTVIFSLKKAMPGMHQIDCKNLYSFGSSVVE